MSDEKRQQFRRLIERRLGGRLNDREWQTLNEEGRISEHAMSEAQVDALVALIQDRRTTWGAGAAAEPDAEQEKKITDTFEGEVPVPEESERIAALERIVAREAGSWPAVREFRRDRLHGNLIARNKVREWILSQSHAESPGISGQFLPLELPVPFETVAKAKSAVERGEPTQQFLVFEGRLMLPAEVVAKGQPRMISIYVPEEDVVEVAHMKYEPGRLPQGGLLYELSALGMRLAAEYAWSEAEAVTFVLTDYIPRIVPARYKIQAGRSDIPAVARVILTLDPAVAPQSVVEVYRTARQKALPGGRVRDLSEKHRLLALFYDEHQAEGKSTDELMALWNADHPDKQYHKRAFFTRDCRMALARLQQQREK